MKSCLTDRRGAGFFGAVLIALTVLVSGCGRPDDEAWLRFLGFHASGETASLSVLNGDLRDGTDLMVDVEFQNDSLVVGGKSGTGVLVNHAHIDYRMSGFSPPDAEYPLNLYLPPPTESTPYKDTLTVFPLAPISLKQWLIDAGVSAAVVKLTADVTFYGTTDEGNPLETQGSIGIALKNSGGGGGTPPTKPTVNIKALNNGKRLPLTNGKFRVERSDNPPTNLTVVFSLPPGAGVLTSGTDYELIGTSVIISATQTYKDIEIIPKSGGNTGSVKINLVNNNDTYTIDTTYKSATLLIE